jgi:hypothetical protein
MASWRYSTKELARQFGTYTKYMAGKSHFEGNKAVVV